ncbi:MAG: hypothetical protein JNM89_12665 [Hyphomicrobiaceae bacterium]|nr:hypothetical protein [Hyphomicrobiaceae bacterium]
MTQSFAAVSRRAAPFVTMGLAVTALAGCGMSSLTSGLGGGVFGGNSSSSSASADGVSEEQLLIAAKADGATPGAAVTGAIDPGCPRVVSDPRDNNITFYEAGRSGDGLAIMHRGEITKMARECHVEAGRVVIKYGFSGRVLLGPRGQSGVVTLPVNISVMDAKRAPVAADAVKLSVAVALDKPIGYFSAVREVSFALPEGSRPGEFQVQVAFDRKTPGAG